MSASQVRRAARREPHGPSRGPRSTARRGRGVLWLALALAALAAAWWALDPLGRPSSAGQAALPTPSGTGLPARSSAPQERVSPPAPSAEATPPASESSEATQAAPAGVGALYVEVLDHAGAPSTGLPVFVTRGREAARMQPTDVSGLAEFSWLESGVWVVGVGGAQQPLLEALEVEVRAGVGSTVRVQLPVALREVAVQVLDEAGRPAPGVALSARCGAGGEPTAVTDHDGRAVLRHVRPGVVRVFANDEHLGRGNTALELQAELDAQVTIRLQRRP